MLTIIGGQFRGKRLTTPKGKDFRPTLGKTREALFSIITSRFELTDYDCYDLFAGSGALGLEALSRGARNAVFIEINKHHYKLVQQNIEHLTLKDRASVFLGNAVQWLAHKNWEYPQNLFIIDPPYQTDLAQEIIDELGKSAHSLQESLVVVETAKKKKLIVSDCMTLFQQKTYGSTKLEFFQILN